MSPWLDGGEQSPLGCLTFDGALEAALRENEVVDSNLDVMPFHSAGHKVIHVLRGFRRLELAIDAWQNLNKTIPWVSAEAIAKVRYADTAPKATA